MLDEIKAMLDVGFWILDGVRAMLDFELIK
jgi:hypothetical protein